jgi:hypothetical protein
MESVTNYDEVKAEITKMLENLRDHPNIDVRDYLSCLIPFSHPCLINKLSYEYSVE